MLDYDVSQPSSDELGKEIAKLTKSRGLDELNPLPSVVADSWRRCLGDHNLQPDRVPRPRVMSQTEIRDLAGTYGDLLAIATPEVERLFQRLVDSEYLVSLASPQGAMFLFRCDYQLLGDMTSFGVIPGSIWTEDLQGTNGVGTCLRVRRPVTIVGGHHYGADIQSLTCLVAPVVGRDGAIDSVLNVTTPRSGDERSNRVVQDIVERASRRIENRYFSKIHQGSLIVRLSTDRDYADLAEEARVVISEDGRLVAATSTLAALAGRPVSDIVGQSADAFFDLARGVEDLPLDRAFPVMMGDKIVHATLVDRRSNVRPQGFLRSAGGPVGVVERIDQQPLSGRHLDPLTNMALERAAKLLEAGLPIVITGESGTGKTTLADTVARQRYADSATTFVLDCANASPTGIAAASRPLVSMQGPRTIILDRLDELDEAGQTTVLAMVEALVQVEGVGLIVISSQDLDSLGRNGLLRQDLVHRLKGGSIELPPLRTRPDLDGIISLVLKDELTSLGKQQMKLSEDARLVLANHYWPGNLRELHYAVRHAAVLADRDVIELNHLPAAVVAEIARKDLKARSQAEASRIEAALRFNGGNVSRTAKNLGVSRATLYRKIQIQKAREEALADEQ